MNNPRWGDGTETLRSEKLFNRSKKKVYYVDLKENTDGRFLKITEACGGKRDTIVIPEDLADAFIGAVQRVKGEPNGHP
jgi:thiamine pyrophosphate-dependent acetolactate synthase large subunit-like protein